MEKGYCILTLANLPKGYRQMTTHNFVKYAMHHLRWHETLHWMSILTLVHYLQLQHSSKKTIVSTTFHIEQWQWSTKLRLSPRIIVSLPWQSWHWRSPRIQPHNKMKRFQILHYNSVVVVDIGNLTLPCHMLLILYDIQSWQTSYE